MRWSPVVFTFSFTNKELQNQPLTTLQDRFEHLDIKLLTEYHAKWTTHVVSKKRNTAKGLQALINAKYIVTESFLDAVAKAAEPPDEGDGTEPSALERDFNQYWPNAMEHLPPRGGEPVQHPDETYTPDVRRKDIFEGYTFIFYDHTQYNNLLAPITDGGGKALLENVTPDETEVDNFIRYVKAVVSEKGLGSFEDGSEGGNVVLVRYVPAKAVHVEWYTSFFTSVSLRLDHRPIEQSEFLEAILIKNASILRRPLEIESSANTQEPRPTRSRGQDAVLQQPADKLPAPAPDVEEVPESQPAPRRPRGRRPVKRRFAGFDDGSDIDMDDAPPTPAAENSRGLEDEPGLFVSQEPSEPPEEPGQGRRSQRKRQAPAVPEDDLMDGMTLAAARFKRQRIERGETFASPTPEPEPEAATPEPKKKPKKEIDILAVAAQNREQEEERARRENEDLANLPDDVDLAEIRRLNLVEEMEVRQPAGAARTREQDIADGRWDPKWNGMKNFKKFRRRGEAVGRQLARNIVPLAEVKNKEFGVGDDYWLEDEGSQRKRKTGSQPSAIESQNSAPPAAASTRASRVVQSDSEDDDEDESSLALDSIQSTTRSGRAAPSQTRSSGGTQSSRQTGQGKRPAAELSKESPAKRPRAPRKPIEVPDSEDSDDELKFRFGKRR